MSEGCTIHKGNRIFTNLYWSGIYENILLIKCTAHPAGMKLPGIDQYIDSSMFLQIQTWEITNILISC